MSAAATAAGYLYASGRLRGRGARDGENAERQPEKEHSARRREIRVAVYPSEPEAPQAAARPARTPKIQYRTRRWKPE
jgi:hypothetical protein